MVEAFTCLYVEDDSLSREIIQVMMQVMGVTALTVFEDSTDFRQRIQHLSAAPDVILLDIQVRPSNGYEMLKMLRSDARCRQARIVALTAGVMKDQLDRLRLAGFDGAIAKPVDLKIFPRLIARILNGDPVWHIG